MPDEARHTTGVDRLKTAGRVTPAVLAVVLTGYVVYELREGWEKADHVASVAAAILAGLAIVTAVAMPWMQRRVKSASVGANELILIRENVKDRREAEAQESGLLTGLMLPVTIGDVELDMNGDVSAPQTVSRAARLFAWIRLDRSDDVPDTEQALLWDYETFTSRWAQFVFNRYQARSAGGAAAPVRMVVHGTGGVGKSTLALMLTLGLVRRDANAAFGVCTDEVTPVPLLVSLSDFDGRLPFTRWINRKARRLYPALEHVTIGPEDRRGLVGRLMNTGLAVLVLDGWDEMPSVVREQAATGIRDFLRDTDSIIIFSRATTADEAKERIGALAGRLEIIPVNRPAMVQRQAYLRHRAGLGAGERVPWDKAAVEGLAVALQERPELAEVLSTPMLLDLAARGVGLGNVTIDDLMETAGNNQENATRKVLLRAHVNWALKDFPGPNKVLTNARSTMWLTHLVHVMTQPGRDQVIGRPAETNTSQIPDRERRQPSYQLSWWRTVSRAPRTVLAVAAALSLLPAYWLALQMPVGLTRGLAIGCGVGVGAAFLRDRPIVWSAAPLVWLVIAGEVLLVGTLLRDVRQAMVDALEIASSVTAAYLVLDTLLRSRWPRRLKWQPKWAQESARWIGRWSRRRLLGAARMTRRAPRWIDWLWRWSVLVPGRRTGRLAAPTVMTLVTGFIGWAPPVLFRHLIGFDDPERKVAMVYVGTTFGIGLATIAARAYITKKETIPDEVRVTREPRAEPGIHALLVGLLFATSIGVGGAVGGWMRYGFWYAVVALGVFLAVAGIPVGFVGGMVKWLCSPLAQPKHAIPEGAGAANPAHIDPDADDEQFTRPESVVPMRSDRTLALSILGSITALAAATIWVLINVFPHTTETIRANATGYAIGPEDAPLVALTLGVIVACTYTAWPAFLFSHLWLVARGELPWRLQLYATELQQARIIIRDGDTYKLRYAGLRTYLGEELYYDLRPHLVRPEPVVEPERVGAG